jgi:hypothetical protein
MIGLNESTLITLSASKLKTFNACERKFYYEYVDRQETVKHPAAALGTAVHKTIERVYREQIDPVPTFVDEFGKELLANNLNIDDVKPQLARDGIKMISQYNFLRRVPDEMELEFTLPFPNAAHPLCNIRGFMDQLYEWGFVDLKTNTFKPLNSVLDNDIQFILYDWAFEEIYNYRAQRKIWHHLRTGEDLYSDTEGKLDNAVRVIERILDSSVTGIYDRSIGDPCRICSHRLICLGRAD